MLVWRLVKTSNCEFWRKQTCLMSVRAVARWASRSVPVGGVPQVSALALLEEERPWKFSTWVKIVAS